MPSLKAKTTLRVSVAGGGLSRERALTCPLDGARCESTAGVDVGSTTENGNVDAERPA
jgi:hypothetical protein